MLIQAPQIEQILRADLGYLLAQALDQAASIGTGAGASPKGIVATSGVKKFAGTFADPQNPTIAELDRVFGGMIGSVTAADISGQTGFLANPRVKTTMNMYRDGDGAVIGTNGMWQGEPEAFSTQIPANGGASTNLATIIYGAWNDLILGYWSSIDIVLNPYADSVARKGGCFLHAFLDADVAVRHPESFAFTDNFPVQSATFTTVS